MYTDVLEHDRATSKFLAGMALEICKRNLADFPEDPTKMPDDEPSQESYEYNKNATICGNLNCWSNATHSRGRNWVQYNLETVSPYLEAECDSSDFVVNIPGIYQASYHFSRSLDYLDKTFSDIRNYLDKAVALAYKHFPTIQEININKEQDPETEDEWLLIDITVDGEIEEVLDSYDDYIEEWVLVAPPSVRENIRLSYNIE